MSQDVTAVVAGSSRVGVVLVNWNSAALTRACIESLLGGREQPWKIVVVDNGSAEPFQAGDLPRTQVLLNAENLGFCAANNIGIRHLLDAGATAVWVLNNDTTVDAGCLASLSERLASDPAVAVVVPKILYADPPGRLWYAGGTVSAWRAAGAHRGLNQPDGAAFDRPSDVTFATGCAMLVRRETWARAGLFCEAFFAYYEDVEWSLRVRAAGLRMAYVPAARVHHKVHAVLRLNLASRGGYPPRFHFLSARNRLYTVRLHAAGAWLPLGLAAVAASNAGLLAGLAVRGRRDKLVARWRGLCDGFRDARPTQTV
ncbi:MAG: glycosyltransferase family 2 protein [Lentisphaerae bacterium]|nr:glycosyltransferase family 2 protein [Lentisphaerota bacterium]